MEVNLDIEIYTISNSPPHDSYYYTLKYNINRNMCDSPWDEYEMSNH